MAGQPGLFDLDERYTALSAAGDPLERLAAVVEFELFRPELDAALARSDRARGGRAPYDAVADVLANLVTSMRRLVCFETRIGLGWPTATADRAY